MTESPSAHLVNAFVNAASRVGNDLLPQILYVLGCPAAHREAKEFFALSKTFGLSKAFSKSSTTAWPQLEGWLGCDSLTLRSAFLSFEEGKRFVKDLIQSAGGRISLHRLLNQNKMSGTYYPASYYARILALQYYQDYSREIRVEGQSGSRECIWVENPLTEIPEPAVRDAMTVFGEPNLFSLQSMAWMMWNGRGLHQMRRMFYEHAFSEAGYERAQSRKKLLDEFRVLSNHHDGREVLHQDLVSIRSAFINNLKRVCRHMEACPLPHALVVTWAENDMDTLGLTYQSTRLALTYLEDKNAAKYDTDKATWYPEKCFGTVVSKLYDRYPETPPDPFPHTVYAEFGSKTEAEKFARKFDQDAKKRKDEKLLQLYDKRYGFKDLHMFWG